MGKLIVIEGTDGSGKSTQFRLLTERIAKEGHEFQKLVFPQYDILSYYEKLCGFCFPENTCRTPCKSGEEFFTYGQTNRN